MVQDSIGGATSSSSGDSAEVAPTANPAHIRERGRSSTDTAGPAGGTAGSPEGVCGVTGTVEEAGVEPVMVELCGLGIASGDLHGVLRRVTQLATIGIPAVDAASVLVGDPAGPELVVTSGLLAQAGDGLQFRAAAGPSFDAFQLNHDVAVRDLAGDPRLAPPGPHAHRSRDRRSAHDPQGARDPYGAAAAAQFDVPVTVSADAPVRSCVAFPLAVDHTVRGVLTFYSCRPSALGGTIAATLACPFVARAQALIRDTQKVGEIVTERDQLRHALQYRSVIEQAKGMIMHARRCDAAEAFAVLVRMSNMRNTKLRQVAQQFVADGGHLDLPRHSPVRPIRPRRD